MADIENLEAAVSAANQWISDLMQQLGWHDRRKAGLALVAGLHALRDCLPTDEAIFVGGHLPPLVRGFYYEGWHPSRRPASLKTRAGFLGRIADGVHRDPGIDAEQVARAVLALVALHLPAAELEDAKAATPTVLYPFWPS